MSAIQSILEGVIQQSQAREHAERKADATNEAEKLAGAGGQAGASAEAEQVQELSTAEMNQAIQMLSKAVLEMQSKLESKGE